MSTNRRNLLFSGAASLAGLSTLAPAVGQARARGARTPAGGVALVMDDAALLSAFVKARYSLDDRLTLGWVDAVTWAVVDGATYPLYRLLAGTWNRVRRVDDTRYEGRTLETAYFFDVETGEPLRRLKMPINGEEVEVKPYRSGPSNLLLATREGGEGSFDMARETREASSFFRAGRRIRAQSLSQPIRDGDDFLVRQDLDTRVMPPQGRRPVFFYREWTITTAAWRDVQNARLASIDSTLQYTAIAAFRPWMKMDGIEGHTTQNGRGAKAERVEHLPPRFVEFVQRHDPDLLDDPQKVLGALP